MLVCFSPFTTPTTALFNDRDEVIGSIHVGWEETSDEWDKSSLSFFAAGTVWIDNRLQIYASIKNGSDSRQMKGPVTYELYWAAKGNPKNGEMVETGQIPALGPGGEYTLYALPQRVGNYMFKAYQRPGHPGKGELWSESISVQQVFTFAIANEEILSAYLKGLLTEEDLIALENGAITEEMLLLYIHAAIDREELELLKNGQLSLAHLFMMKEEGFTLADIIALQEGKITQDDLVALREGLLLREHLDAYLRGELTREELDQIRSGDESPTTPEENPDSETDTDTETDTEEGQGPEEDQGTEEGHDPTEGVDQEEEKENDEQIRDPDQEKPTGTEQNDSDQQNERGVDIGDHSNLRDEDFGHSRPSEEDTVIVGGGSIGSGNQGATVPNKDADQKNEASSDPATNDETEVRYLDSSMRRDDDERSLLRKAADEEYENN